jgi:uncharacterized membrane protein
MLVFQNQYPAKVWVAITFWSPETCRGEGGNWETMGWWGIDAGGSKNVYNNDVDDLNQYYYFYAKAADGAEWAADYGPLYVYHEVFNSCINIGSTAAYAVVGMKEIDVNGYDNYTLTLTP